jgi:hypothetical protein
MTPDLYMLSQLRTVLEAAAAAVRVVALLFCVGLLVVLAATVLVVVTVHFGRFVMGEAEAWRGVRSGAGEAEGWWARPRSMPTERTQPVGTSRSVTLDG